MRASKTMAEILVLISVQDPDCGLQTTSQIFVQVGQTDQRSDISVQTELISIYSSITDRDGDCYQTDQHHSQQASSLVMPNIEPSIDSPVFPV